MTCHAARRLLPLFAGGDLNERSKSAVAGHVATCEACRAEVEELKAARSLLPLSSLSFSESERMCLRRGVLDEIARRNMSPSPFAGFLLRPQFALAVLAGVAVLGASLIAPFFVRNEVEPSATIRRPDPAATPAPPATPVSPVEHVEERIAQAAARPPGPSRKATPASRPTAVARPLWGTAPASGPALRFEIQTGNVNVRIIWFAGGPSGDKSSSDPAGDPNGVS